MPPRPSGRDAVGEELRAGDDRESAQEEEKRHAASRSIEIAASRTHAGAGAGEGWHNWPASQNSVGDELGVR
jgi:hypothetical protein